MVNALCNTLVHSLWQGILLAAVAGLVVIGTKRSTPTLRYNLLVSALTVFAAGVALTFVLQFKNSTPTIAIHHAPDIVTTSLTPRPTTDKTVTTLTQTISGFLGRYDGTIVLIWFLIICARSIQLGAGLYGTYRLRCVNVSPITGPWLQRMQELATTMGIKKTVALLESGLANVPLVIGHLKPAILIPMGLLTTLPPEEVEAILRHELAHIRRRDWLVNLLQSFMEIVFFFNPAVLWVSRLIKNERENCCDDLALGHGNDKVNYIRALLSCEAWLSRIPPHAMALAGSKHSLLQRVRRLAGNFNHSLSLFEKTLLTLCLVIAGLYLSAFVKKTPHPPAPVASLPSAQPTPQFLQPFAILSGTTPAAPTRPSHKNPYTYDYGYEPRRYGIETYHHHLAGYYNNELSLDSLNHAADRAILADMVRDGIILSPDDNLTFRLTKKSFLVNDIKQNDEIFQRYKEKYVPAEAPDGYTWSHSQHFPH
jgi:beta-lactamase regulating signal transducer with metallopeptidase domain